MSGNARAFAHLNLVRNPFGEVHPAERGALVVAELSAALERLGEPGGVVQIVGECGRGKTSHLLALKLHFPSAPYVRIDPDRRRPSIPRSPVVFLDEVQWLPAGPRRRLFARPHTRFALGSHEDLAPELEALGRPVLTLWPGRELTVQRLEAAFARRIEWARRAPGPVPVVPRRTVEQLMTRAIDDVRTMEGLLYEAVQRTAEIGDIVL